MKTNNIGATLFTIGIFTIIIGIVGSMICGIYIPKITYSPSNYSGVEVETRFNYEFAIIGAVASFITGVCIIGLSEIINLLQKNSIYQQTLVELSTAQLKIDLKSSKK